jgi:hypothetical protein
MNREQVLPACDCLIEEVDMGKLYVVPDKLLPVTEGLYRTFLEDCEKDARVEVNKQPPNIAWFLVEDHPKQKEDGIVRVRGAIGSARFKLYVNAVSACFEMDRDTPAAIEQVFYVFVQVAANYRTMRRLSPLNKHVIDGLAIEDSPPVNAENYMEMPEDDEIKRLGKLIDKNFTDVSFNECNGVLCYYICCALADDDVPRSASVQADANFIAGLNRISGGRGFSLGLARDLIGIHRSLGGSLPSTPRHVYVPMSCVPVYTELLNSFKTAFPSEKAKLFAVRWKARQRLFFVTERGRVYCCKTDGSREFLGEHFDVVFRTLSRSRFKSTKMPPGSDSLHKPE